MSRADGRPPWLPPLPSAHPGRWLIVTGLIILSGVMAFIVFMTVTSGTHNLYTLVAFVIGLAFVFAGLLKRQPK